MSAPDRQTICHLPPSPMGELESLLMDHDEAGARDLLAGFPAPLDGYAAGAMLTLAMDCSLDLFRTVLDCCAPGEYALEVHLPDRNQNPDDPGTFWMNGTLALICAAKDRPEHLRILLERGWDVNGNSPASRAALEANAPDTEMDLTPTQEWEPVPPDEFFPRNALHTLHASGSVSALSGLIHACRTEIRILPRCTPLAAAITCGSRACARLLWNWPGVRRTEDPSVCRAIALEAEVWTSRGELLRVQADPDNHTGVDLLGGDPDAIFRTVPLRPSAWAGDLSPFLLRLQLESGLCDREEAVRLLRLLDPANPRWTRRYLYPDAFSLLLDGDDPDSPVSIPVPVPDPVTAEEETRRAELLKMVLDLGPSLPEEPWITGVLLRVFLRLYACSGPTPLCLEFAARWHRLCGDQGDLTWGAGLLREFSPRQMRPMLRILREGTRLWMDSCADLGDLSPENLRLLMADLRIRPVSVPDSLGEVTGSLTHCLLRSGTLRMVKRAADLGAFSGENPEYLLSFCEKTGRDILRPVLLTLTPGPALSAEDLEPGKKACFSLPDQGQCVL